MKVTCELEDLEPKYYFRHLCDRIIADVKKSTDKEITVKDLMDGYKYERKVTYRKLVARIQMEVGPLKKDEFFVVRYDTQDTTGMYYYNFYKQDDKYYVSYAEDTEYKKKTFGNTLGNLKKGFQEKATQRKAFENIQSTVTYIKNHMPKEGTK